MYISPGHVSTHTKTVSCFGVGKRCRQSHKNQCSITELQEVESHAEKEGEKNIEEQDNSAHHLYDFPTLFSSGKSDPASQQDSNVSGQFHNYELPEHCHLATQYEIPVTAYEYPTLKPQVDIYKNTLSADAYVPTLVRAYQKIVNFHGINFTFQPFFFRQKDLKIRYYYKVRI